MNDGNYNEEITSKTIKLTLIVFGLWYGILLMFEIGIMKTKDLTF